jgi:excisionase family DNA binding protein
MEKRNLSVQEFADLYGICRTRVYQQIKLGNLKPFKVGKSTLISKEAAEKWQKKMEKLNG